MKPSPIAIWIEAARPRTLPAAVAPVITGTALAEVSGGAKPLAALLCLAFALLAQVAANFANDYFDFVKGADTSARVGPRRAVASGLVAPSTMRRATYGVCLAAFAVGLCLLPYGGWVLLVVGVSSIVCALAYTGGPYPLGYHGLGDVFVFVFFGLVAVGTTHFVQTGSFDPSILPAAIAIGALTVNILVVNNYRDVDTDRMAGKRTLVVRFGRRFAQGQFIASHVLALAAPPVIAMSSGRSIFGSILVSVILGFWAVRQTRALIREREPAPLIRLLGDSGRYLAVYSIAFSAWILLSR